MNRRNGYQWLSALSLLCCLPSFATTIYKSIDENGVISFSDARPAEEILVETVVIDDQMTPPSGQEQQRLQDMRETTDRMVADRMAREKHRAELRQLEAQTDAQQAAQNIQDNYDNAPIYTGYYNYPVRRPWWPPQRPWPDHPIACPPLRPPVNKLPPGIRPLPGNDYPASLIRKSYDPKVREALR
jgi:Domain of unknown function (DUF4124)